MTILYQVLATSIICYICTTLGILYTLPSSTVKLFRSDNTTLDRIMTETEISLMGSLSSASSLIATPFCGYLLDRVGRKNSMILFYLPQLFGWVVIVTSYKVESFIFSMFLCGLSGSLFVIAPVYINEYCHESIRGSMTTSAMIFYGIGLMVSYIFGGCLDYVTMSYIGLIMSIIALILLCFMKESPLYLMAKGLEKEAIQAIAFYRGCKPNSKPVIDEFENMKRIINLDIKSIDGIPEECKLKPDENMTKNLSVWNFMAKSRSSRRALTITLIVITTTIFQGIVVVQMFAEPLLEEAIPNMSPTVSSVIFAIVLVIGSLIGAYLVDTVGRRLLLIITSFANGLCSVVLGTQLHFNWGPSWVTVVFILLYAICYSVGPGSVPIVLIGEVFLPEIRSFASTICVEWTFFCSFLVLFIFNSLFNMWGLGPIFYLFAGFCFMNALFSFIYLPETKGLQIDVIQRKFLNRKKKTIQIISLSNF